MWDLARRSIFIIDSLYVRLTFSGVTDSPNKSPNQEMNDKSFEDQERTLE
jgi:hypothetical protein